MMKDAHLLFCFDCHLGYFVDRIALIGQPLSGIYYDYLRVPGVVIQ